MVIVSQLGQIFNFGTAHSIDLRIEDSGIYAAKINFWLPRENPHLSGQQYLISYTLGEFRTKEAAEEVYAELIEAFDNGDELYRVPKEACA